MFALVPLLLALLVGPARADTPVDTLAPEIRDVYEEAEAAWSEGDLVAAEDGFRQVTVSAPTFDRAWRRLCGVVLNQDRVDEAQTACRQAVALSDGHENRTAMAIALVQGDPGSEEAQRLIEGVLETHPDYEPAWVALCTWAAAIDRVPALNRCVGHLQGSAPNTAGTLFYQSVLEAAKGEVQDAQNTLLEAQQRGLPDDLYVEGSQRIQAAMRRVSLAAKRKQHKADKVPEGSFSPADLLPLLVLGALVLAVGVLLLGSDEDADED